MRRQLAGYARIMWKEWYDRQGDSWVTRRHPPPPKQATRGRHRCEACHGTGQIPGVVKTKGRGMGSTFGTCPECDGVGWVDDVETKP